MTDIDTTARDRLMARRAAALTPEQRFAAAAALEDRAYSILRSSPSGMEDFMRRNLRHRAVEAPRSG
jgi:hypothetical protein